MGRRTFGFTTQTITDQAGSSTGRLTFPFLQRDRGQLHIQAIHRSWNPGLAGSGKLNIEDPVAGSNEACQEQYEVISLLDNRARTGSIEIQ
jgi:hypothetical protein